jgi:ankyrin repeat protein
MYSSVKSFVLALATTSIALTSLHPESRSVATQDQALLKSMRDRDEQLVSELIAKRIGVNSRDEMGTTPLMWAAQHLRKL